MSDSHLLQLILGGALAVDLILGEYPDYVHPVLYMGNYIKYLWDKRPSAKGRQLFIWGAFLVLSGIAVFTLLPYFLLSVLPGFTGALLAVFLLKPAFALKALIKAALEVKKALEEEKIDEARELTSRHLVSRNTEDLPEEEVCGAVIESVAENLTDGFISPFFFFSLGGVPAAWGYRFVNTCDSLLGYRKDDYEQGGKFAARLDDVLNWIPARLAGFLLVLSSLIMGEDWKCSWKTMMESNNKTSSPNAGWTMAAMAGALGVKLEKRGEYSLDGGENPLTFHFIGRALKLIVTAAVIFFILTIAVLEVII